MLNAAVKLKKKKVWAGVYGGHYDIIVFFSKKPKRISRKALQKLYYIAEGRWPKGYYDCMSNESLIIGDMGLPLFQKMFGVDLSEHLNNGRPKDTEIIELFQIELTAPFDENGNMLHFHIDWANFSKHEHQCKPK